MSALNARLRGVALDLITRFGMDAELVVTEIARDKAAGSVYKTDAQRYSVRVSPPEPYFQDVNGQRVAVDELVTSMAAQGAPAVPQRKQKLLVAGREHTILSVRPVYGGNDPVLYEMRLSS